MTNRSTRLWTVAAVAITAAAAAIAVLAMGNDEEFPDGPLLMTNGHMTNMLQPLGEPAFIAVPACVEGTDEPTTVRLESVRATEVTGANANDIRYLAAWPAQNNPLRVAAAGISMLEDEFRPYQDTQGLVMPCGHPSPVTGLEIATVLPAAEDTAVVIDGLDLTYTIGDDNFTDHVDVTLGMCSSAPDTPADEPEECP